MKYRYILNRLDPQTLYTAASIAKFAQDEDLLQGDTESRRKQSYQRLRIAMGRFKDNANFPKKGDGMVKLKGQPPYQGWFGWRWAQIPKDKKEKDKNLPSNIAG